MDFNLIYSESLEVAGAQQTEEVLFGYGGFEEEEEQKEEGALVRLPLELVLNILRVYGSQEEVRRKLGQTSKHFKDWCLDDNEFWRSSFIQNFPHYLLDKQPIQGRKLSVVCAALSTSNCYSCGSTDQVSLYADSPDGFQLKLCVKCQMDPEYQLLESTAAMDDFVFTKTDMGKFTPITDRGRRKLYRRKDLEAAAYVKHQGSEGLKKARFSMTEKRLKLQDNKSAKKNSQEAQLRTKVIQVYIELGLDPTKLSPEDEKFVSSGELTAFATWEGNFKDLHAYKTARIDRQMKIKAFLIGNGFGDIDVKTCSPYREFIKLGPETSGWTLESLIEYTTGPNTRKNELIAHCTILRMSNEAVTALLETNHAKEYMIARREPYTTVKAVFEQEKRIQLNNRLTKLKKRLNELGVGWFLVENSPTVKDYLEHGDERLSDDQFVNVAMGLASAKKVLQDDRTRKLKKALKEAFDAKHVDYPAPNDATTSSDNSSMQGIIMNGQPQEGWTIDVGIKFDEAIQTHDWCRQYVLFERDDLDNVVSLTVDCINIFQVNHVTYQSRVLVGEVNSVMHRIQCGKFFGSQLKEFYIKGELSKFLDLYPPVKDHFQVITEPHYGLKRISDPNANR